jgi:hypothetical protein
MAVGLTALRVGPPFPVGIFVALISIGGSVDPRAIVQLEGLSQLKIPVTSSGIEPVPFQLIALKQHSSGAGIAQSV